MVKYLWYCVEYDIWRDAGYAPFESLKVEGWREYAYWAYPPFTIQDPVCPTGLTEYVYIGEL